MARTKAASLKKKDAEATAAKLIKEKALKTLKKKPSTEAPTEKKKRSNRGAFAQWRAYRKAVLKLSKHTGTLVPKAAFGRVVREIAQGYKADARFTKDALKALQEITELWMTGVFTDAVPIALHADRQKVCASDLKLALYIGEKKQPELASGVHAPLKLMSVNPNKRRKPVKVLQMQPLPRATIEEEDIDIEAENAKMAANLAATGSVLGVVE